MKFPILKLVLLIVLFQGNYNLKAQCFDDYGNNFFAHGGEKYDDIYGIIYSDRFFNTGDVILDTLDILGTVSFISPYDTSQHIEIATTFNTNEISRIYFGYASLNLDLSNMKFQQKKIVIPYIPLFYSVTGTKLIINTDTITNTTSLNNEVVSPGVMVNFSNDSLTLTGKIDSLKFGGVEISIIDICISEYIPENSNTNTQKIETTNQAAFSIGTSNHQISIF